MHIAALEQVAYVSREAHEFSRDSLKDLMVESRRRNRQRELTGMLLFDRPIFLQIIEGPPESLRRIMHTISNDLRHRDIAIIYENNQLREREFARWQMGCKILGDGLPGEFRDLDDRVKYILRAAEPNGELAHQLLLEFRRIENEIIDI